MGCKMQFFKKKPNRSIWGEFSLRISAASLAVPLGFVISGPLAEKFGIEKWFIICGTDMIIVALAAFFLPSSMKIDDANVDTE